MGNGPELFILKLEPDLDPKSGAHYGGM